MKVCSPIPPRSLNGPGTRTPFCSAARELLARGFSPDLILEKVRRGSDRVDMRGKIGAAAKLTVQETGAGPKFRPFEATEDPS
jgi:hypothetical protein